MADEQHKEFYERLRIVERDVAVQGEQIRALLQSTENMANTIKPLIETINKGRGFIGAFWLIWMLAPAIFGAFMGWLFGKMG